MSECRKQGTKVFLHKQTQILIILERKIKRGTVMQKNKAQEDAIKTIYGPVIVISCPGSGKTTTLIRRILHMCEEGIDPKHILMVTFSKASANEMKIRYEKMSNGNGLGVTFCTIHALCLNILVQEGYYRVEDIMTESEKFEVLIDYLKTVPEVEELFDTAKDIISEIGKVKNSYTDLKQYQPQCCDRKLFLDSFKIYETYRKEMGKIDFEDMMLESIKVLQDNQEILKKWQDKFQFIQCDEYQDTNLVQKDLLYLLAGERKNLCVVGDDDQSIYQFRGADPRIMFAFANDFDSVKVIKMSTNYRSTQKIVDSADMLINGHGERFEKKFISNRGQNGEMGEFHYLQFQNKKEEMKEMVERINEAHKRGIPYNQMAILSRTNKQAQSPMLALKEKEIPFCSTEKLESVYQNWIFKLIQTYVRLASGQGNKSDLLYVINRPSRYLKPAMFQNSEYTRESLLKSISYLKNGEEYWRYVKAKEAIDDWMMYFGPGTLTLDSDPKRVIEGLKIMNLEKYITDYARIRKQDPDDYKKIFYSLQRDAGKFKTIRAWYAYAMKDIALTEKLNRSKSADGVQITTMHKSKGLEWKLDFVVDVNDMIVPHKNNLNPAGLNEERRLLYVAMTRAKDELCVMCSGEESPFMTETMKKIRQKKIDTTYPIPDAGRLVQHRTYGIGTVEELQNGKLSVDFAGDIIQFQFPDEFELGKMKYIS